MKRTVTGMLTVLVASLGLTACGSGGNPLSPGTGGQSLTDTITVGSANFAESKLIAEIYAAALGNKGIKVTKRLGIGSRETYLPALKDSSVDLVPEYAGVLLQYLDKTVDKTSADDVYSALRAKVPAGLSVLDKSPAEDKDSIVVTKQLAEKYNAKSIADLAPHCGELIFGGPPEFKTRPDGIPGLDKHYGCRFADYKALDAGGPLTVAALRQNSVQAVDLFTTDSSIKTNDWVVLTDPKGNFAAQNVVPLINTKKATEAVTKVLNAVSAKLDTATLVDLNTRLAGDDHPDASTVASQWLASVGL
ncbi:MAG: ABC transporter substrate-binding protein [Kutzneria sp.]|nr:ABC transporter substrate-binding protein [Kutzneria sp.]MBV9846456.1 ABC transporter substrate-binding protein [Kutzneria sp.]